MLEVNSHKHLKKYYQNNLALWPHNLTLTRLISRSLSRKDNTFFQLSSDSRNSWWPGLLIPLCLHNNNIVLILSERQYRLLFEVELPKLRTSRLGFDYVEGIELTPSDKKIWVLSYLQMQCHQNIPMGRPPSAKIWVLISNRPIPFSKIFYYLKKIPNPVYTIWGSIYIFFGSLNSILDIKSHFRSKLGYLSVKNGQKPLFSPVFGKNP